MEEGLLLKRLARGDRDAFWPLWERVRPHLHRYCLSRLESPEDAEDALSEAMIRAWERLPDQAGRIRNVEAWLTQLTRNVCASLREKRARHAQYVASEADLAPEGDLWERFEVDPEDAVVQREMQAHLLHLIDRLPPSLRQPLLLYAFQEMSYRDVAERLNLSDLNVLKRLQKAREALREGMRDYLTGAPGPWGPARPPAASLETDMEARIVGIEAQAERLLDQAMEEIRWKVADTRVVSIALPSGVTMNYSLLLDRKIPRREVKIETLRQYVQRYPTGWKKRLELAHLLYATGRWEEAVAEYRQVLAKQPRLLDVWLRLGETLRRLERGEEALAAYEEALPHARQPATQHHLRGWMELCRPRPDAAVQEFAQAAALEPRNAAHWHAWASAHDQAGRPCECLQAYDEALKLDPDDLVALTKSHNALTATGQLAEAIRRLERVVELDPNYVYALKMLAAHRSAAGLLYGEEGKKTEQLIRRALRLAPDSADVWETLAHFYVRRGEWEKAWAVLQEFVAQHPDNPKGWFHYAVWHVHTGCYEAAAGAILKALALDPQDFYHYWCACMVLPCAGRRDDLRRVVEEMIERFPGRWDTYIDAGEALVRWLGEADRGCALSAQALQRQPHSPTVWLRHGGLLVQAGRYREAMAALEQGWALLSADRRPGARAGAALGLGRCYQALGDAAPAREWLKKAAHFAREAVAFDPTDGYFYLGQALESLGDVAGAIQAYQAALDHHVWYPQRQKVEETLAHLRDLS